MIYFSSEVRSDTVVWTSRTSQNIELFFQTKSHVICRDGGGWGEKTVLQRELCSLCYSSPEPSPCHASLIKGKQPERRAKIHSREAKVASGRQDCWLATHPLILQPPLLPLSVLLSYSTHKDELETVAQWPRFVINVYSYAGRQLSNLWPDFSSSVF